jgi:S1-C subfamily serine protease
MERNRRSACRNGVSQSWTLLGAVMLVVAVLALSGTRYWPAVVHSRDAQPRPVAARGELLVDEEVAIKAFHTVSSSVVFITSKQVSRSVFSMQATKVEEDAGSGFVWDPNGYIVTNYHVVENSQSVQVTLGNQSVWKAHRVGVNPDKDIAVLKIEAPPNLLPAIPIGRSSDLQVGQRVYALGNPFGYDQTMTSGIISGLGREITSVSGRPIKGVIQTDAPLNPGNSGGPLIDSAGRVIGMNTAILSPTGAYAGIGFATPIDTINRIVPQIIRGDTAPQPSLGVTLAPDHLVRRLGYDGVLIVSTEPNAPARKAGLCETRRSDLGKIVFGDLITAVNGEPVRTEDEFLTAIDKHKVGDTVQLSVRRDGKKITVPVTLEACP